MKILLVDDDSFLRDMYATKFSQSGDEVDTATDGKNALTILREKEFDVIIIDMIMPGMTGLEVIEAIKAEALAPDVKIIVLSNQGEHSDIDAATKLGVDGYIIKAESIPSEVVDKVHKIVL